MIKMQPQHPLPRRLADLGPNRPWTNLRNNWKQRRRRPPDGLSSVIDTRPLLIGWQQQVAALPVAVYFQHSWRHPHVTLLGAPGRQEQSSLATAAVVMKSKVAW